MSKKSTSEIEQARERNEEGGERECSKFCPVGAEHAVSLHHHAGGRDALTCIHHDCCSCHMWNPYSRP